MSAASWDQPARCYVCNALPEDGCGAIGGEVAECPRPYLVQLQRADWPMERRDFEDLWWRPLAEGER